MSTRFPLVVAGTLLLLSGCSRPAPTPAQEQAASSAVVATIGGQPITLAEVDVQALQQPVSNFGSARLAQALYLARRAALDEMIGNRLLDAEAKVRGIDRAALVKKEITDTATAPTDADVEFWYQSNPNAVQGRPIDTLREAIKSLLMEQRLTQAQTTLIDSLKAKTQVTTSLDPPRQTVATAGHPSRGSANAPIELVEFSDFQCPFCQRANPTVAQVLMKYGDRIHFVYRHFPLAIHPNAFGAAEAAACANSQGKFWEYHDRLFADQTKLSTPDLKAHAAALGLDAPKFNACVDGHQSKPEIDQDMQEAQALGVTGTPAFFINGRPLEGAQPYEAFAEVIDEELALKK